MRTRARRWPILFVVFAAAFAAPASWAQDAVVIAVQNHRFQPPQPQGAAGAPFKLQIKNLDTVPVEFSSPTLRVSALVSPHTSETVQVPALPPGRYSFVDLAHSATRGAMTLR